MPVPGRFWGIGFAAAVLAHAVIVVLIFWQPPESGARAPGRGGIEVSLGAAGAPPGSAAESVATADTRTVEPEEAISDSTPRDTTAARPVEDADAAEPETVETREVEPQAAAWEQPDADTAQSTPTEAAPIPQTLDSPQVESEITPAEQPDPAQSPPTEPVKTRQPETAVTARAPEQVAMDPVPEEEQAAVDAVPDEEPTTSAPSSQAGTGGTSGANVGSGESASAGGTPGPSDDYMAQLSAWLEKHKQYPRRAQRRRQEGTALLQFVIDREGRVIEYRIRESSGHEILDEEVAAMIERAQPLPGIPDDMPRARLELVVPIQFLLM
ncbi:MAG: energy transducer TonB [Gammaproteobacteria bacterium]|nr:energy transducer TonB [Gammaproteobacteria bacterium]